MLRNFFERFLYRLGRSPVRERFVLKRAMLLRLWAYQPYRSTLDLDLLAHGSSDTESVGRDIANICKTDVDDDGIRFVRAFARRARLATTPDSAAALGTRVAGATGQGRQS